MRRNIAFALEGTRRPGKTIYRVDTRLRVLHKRMRGGMTSIQDRTVGEENVASRLWRWSRTKHRCSCTRLLMVLLVVVCTYVQESEGVWNCEAGQRGVTGARHTGSELAPSLGLDDVSFQPGAGGAAGDGGGGHMLCCIAEKITSLDHDGCMRWLAFPFACLVARCIQEQGRDAWAAAERGCSAPRCPVPRCRLESVTRRGRCRGRARYVKAMVTPWLGSASAGETRNRRGRDGESRTPRLCAAEAAHAGPQGAGDIRLYSFGGGGGRLTDRFACRLPCHSTVPLNRATHRTTRHTRHMPQPRAQRVHYGGTLT